MGLTFRLKFQILYSPHSGIRILTRIWHPVEFRDEYIKRLLCSLIIFYVFCANYKVWEGFEFSREELGVKDEEQMDFMHNVYVSGMKVLLAYL